MIFTLLLLLMEFSQGCKEFFGDPIRCIMSTEQNCNWKELDNSCDLISSVLMGCQPTMNIVACRRQQMNQDGSNLHCYFEKLCREIKNVGFFEYIECDNQRMSEMTCLRSKNCQWNAISQSCQKYQPNKNANECSQHSLMPVSKYDNELHKCQNYLSKATDVCNVEGLSKSACLSSKLPCIFRDQVCLEAKEDYECNEDLSRSACLNIKSIACRWISNQCTYVSVSVQCENLTDVNSKSCQQLKEDCSYDKNQQKCSKNFDINGSCDQAGLSQGACLKILGTRCIFVSGQCRSLGKTEQRYYLCESALNQDSCLQLLTQDQSCTWNEETGCNFLLVSRNIGCQDVNKTNPITCSRIVKEACKYDEDTSTCVDSTSEDRCDTPFISYLGCTNISGMICQWNPIRSQCSEITVIKGITKCDELKLVNKEACQLQSTKGDTIAKRACKWDQNIQSCSYFTEFHHKCDEQGLNRIGCVNTVKENGSCQWTSNTCWALNGIGQIPCLSLTDVSSQACSLATFNNQPCKYNPQSYSCVKSIDVINDNCQTLGLNEYACYQLKSYSCYFDKEKQQCVDESSLQLAGSRDCSELILSRDVCLSISNPLQNCQWSMIRLQCTFTRITDRNFCNDFKENVNANVCASIHPKEQLDESFCRYSKEQGGCISLNENEFDLPCSTEGLNIYACSARTVQNKKCLFDFDSMRCKELVEEDEQKELVCEQLNYLSCTTLTNEGLFCVWDGICKSVAIAPELECSTYSDSRFQTNSNVCIAISKDPCEYDLNFRRCRTVYGRRVCESYLINQKACLERTIDEDQACQWDQERLKCLRVVDFGYVECESANKIACLKISNKQCVFKQNKCSTIQESDCNKLKENDALYNSYSCRAATIGFCQYNLQSQSCQNVPTKVISECQDEYINVRLCLVNAGVFVQCQWNDDIKLCEKGDKSQICQKYQSQYLCLEQDIVSCQWNSIDYCIRVEIDENTSCQDVSINFSNQKTCRSIFKKDWYCLQLGNYGLCSGTQYYPESYSSCGPHLNKKACLDSYGTNCRWMSEQCIMLPASNLDTIDCTVDEINLQACNALGCKWNAPESRCGNMARENSCYDYQIAETDTYECQSVNVVDEQWRETTDPNWLGIGTYCMRESQWMGGYVKQWCSVVPMKSLDGTQIQKYTYCNNRFNHIACIQLTETPCKWDFDWYQDAKYCQDAYLDWDICNSDLNRYACLRISKIAINGQRIACQFSESCAEIQIDEKSNCADFTTGTFNSAVCSAITKQGEKCMYNKAKFQCQIVQDTKFQSCDLGLSKSLCEQSGCKYDMTLRECSFSQDFPIDYSKCDVRFSRTLCLQVDGEVCNFSEENGCQQGDSTGLDCQLQALNQGGCYLAESYCKFDQNQIQCIPLDPGQDYYSCQDINKSACLKLTKDPCYWDPQDLRCYEGAKSDTECTEFQNIYSCLEYSVNCEWKDAVCQQSGLTIEMSYGCSEVIERQVSQNICVNANGYCEFVDLWCKKLVSDKISDRYCGNASRKACLEKTSPITCSWDPYNGQCQYDYSGSDCNWEWSPEDCTTYCPFKIICTYFCNPNHNRSLCIDNRGICIFENGECRTFTEIDLANIGCEDVQEISIGTCLAVQQRINENYKIGQISKESCYFSDNLMMPTSAEYDEKCYQVIGVVDCNLYQIMNLQTCVEKSITTCYYSDDTCLPYLPYIQSLCDSGSNLQACVAYDSSQNCKWDKLNLKCSEATELDSCTLYDSNSNYLVNESTCAYITSITEGCLYDSSSHTCNFSSESITCDSPGVNNAACIQNTPNQNCKFFNDKCVYIKLEEQSQIKSCENLNLTACLGFPLACVFQDNQCLNVLEGTSFQELASSKYQNKFSCGLLVGASLYYNEATQTCEQFSLVPNNCSQYFLNYEACMSITDKECLYTRKQGCIDYTQFDGSIEFSCSMMNKGACGKFSENSVGCQYLGDTCQVVEYQIGQTCESLIQANQGACALLNIEEPCIHQDSGCVKVMSELEGCYHDGLNRVGCINWTKGQTCIFNEKKWVCESGGSDVCSNLLNKEGCYGVKFASCQFTDYCRDIEVIKDCDQNKQVNPQVCLRVSDAGCKFVDGNCLFIDMTENCLTPYINRKGCIQQGVSQQCKWHADVCQIAEVRSLNCDDDLNIGSCLSVPSPQQCKWNIDAQRCEYVTVMSDFNCADMKEINNEDICRQIQKQSCMFSQNGCVEVTSQMSITCSQPGLNLLGCRMVREEICTYSEQNACQKSDQVVYCEQALNLESCVGAKDKCKFIEGACSEYSQQDEQFCGKIQPYVSRFVCQSAIREVEDNYCVYDESTYGCVEKTQAQCEQVDNRRQCLNNKENSCLWKDSQCVAVVIQAGKTTCLELSNNGSALACLSVRRQSEFCEYNYAMNECVEFDVLKSGCEEGMYNYNGCIAIMKESCFWDGRCKATQTTEMDCSENLNRLACLTVSKVGQYCAWSGTQCEQIQSHPDKIVDLMTYTRINGQTCTIVNQLGVSAKYDFVNNGCMSIDAQTDSCDSIGLNRNGCFLIVNQPCQWDSITRNCKLKTLFENEEEVNCKYTNVNARFCQLINFNANCQYNNESNECEPINEATRCDQRGLNKGGCMNVYSDTCVWESKSSKCKRFNVVEYLTSCNLVPEFVNAFSCAQVKYYDEICIYNGTSCQTIEQAQLIGCDMNGLNLEGCTQVANEACVFFKGSCQKISSMKNNRMNDYISNPKACQLLQNKKSKYDVLRRKCVDPLVRQKCSQTGLNKEACLEGANCVWDSQCRCKYDQVDEVGVDCASMMSKECQKHIQCKIQNDQCRSKQCSDLDSSNCQIILKNDNCYFNGKKCITVSNCGEIMKYNYNLRDSCNSLKIDGYHCGLVRLRATQQYCVAHPCQYVASIPSTCNGLQIGNQVCVFSGICKSCENIHDLCECDNHPQYCQIINKRCHSKTCSMNDDPLICKQVTSCYWADLLGCLQQCNTIYYQDLCHGECEWDYNSQSCQDLLIEPIAKMEPYQLKELLSQFGTIQVALYCTTILLIIRI